MLEIEVVDAIILETPANRSPIFFVDIGFSLSHSRKGTTKKTFTDHLVKKLVAKGTLDEISNSLPVKKRVIREHIVANGGAKKKALDFDLSRIKIKEIKIRESLGYGIKE